MNPETDTILNDLLMDVFSTFEAENLNYCILRNYEGLPNSIGNDIDLLIQADQVRTIERCLFDIANKQGWSLLKKIKRFGYQSYWFCHDSDGRFVHFDAFSDISWKGLRLVKSDSILTGRTKHKFFYIPAPTDEIFISLMKDLIQGGKIKQKYLGKIKETTAKYPELILKRLLWAMGYKVGNNLMQYLIEGKWHKIETNLKQIRQAVILTRLKSEPLETVSCFKSFLMKHIQTRFSKPNGVFIAFIGPDGSGKSTIASSLSESLSEIFPAQEYYHGRFGIIPDLRRILNVLRKAGRLKSLPPAPSGENAVHFVKPYGRVRALIYLIYYGLDYFLGYWIVLSAKGSGKLIIFDRYYYDYFVMEHFKNLPKIMFKLYRYVLPQPDLLIYLANKPEVIHFRKPELNVEQICRQNSACESIVKILPFAHTFYTDLPIKTIVKKIECQIYELMLARKHSV